jgi:hypothetical protein
VKDNAMGGRIPVNLPEPIVTRLHYQGKPPRLSSPIHEFHGDRRICPCMNSNQDNMPLGEIADNGQPSVLNALALEGTHKVMRRFNRNIDVGCDWAPGQRNFRGSGSRSKSITHCQQKSFDDRFTPEINHAYPQANVSSSSLAQRHDSARVIRPTIANAPQRNKIEQN